MSRRDFITRGTLAVAGAAALAACGDGQFGPETVVAPAGPYAIKVGSFPELSITGQLVVPTGNRFVAVKRTGPLTFQAYSIVCTHQGCLTELQGNALACPCHGARFDSSGAVTQPPRGGTATALPKIATLYDPQNDTLTIMS